MADINSPDGSTDGTRPAPLRLGVDGWANLLVGLATVLAIAGVLPRIPW